MDIRQTTLLTFCRSPKTYEEIAEKLDIGYYAARDAVQQLLAVGFLEEMPFNRRGTRQKQFRAKVFNPETQFTPEGCQIFRRPHVDPMKRASALAITQISTQDFQRLGEILINALSVPMWEYKAHVDPETFTGYPPSSVVLQKLSLVHTILSAFVDLLEEMIMTPVWDEKHPENNAILFHAPIDQIDWDHIYECYSKINQIAMDHW